MQKLQEMLLSNPGKFCTSDITELVKKPQNSTLDLQEMQDVLCNMNMTVLLEEQTNSSFQNVSSQIIGLVRTNHSSS